MDESISPDVWARWACGFSFGLLSTLLSVLVKEEGLSSLMVGIKSLGEGAMMVAQAAPAAPLPQGAPRAPGRSFPSPDSFVHLFDYMPMNQVVVYLGMTLALCICGVFYFYIQHLSNKRDRKAGYFGNVSMPLVLCGLIVAGFAYTTWGQDFLGVAGDDDEEVDNLASAAVDALLENPSVAYGTLGAVGGALGLYCCLGRGSGRRHHARHRKGAVGGSGGGGGGGVHARIKAQSSPTVTAEFVTSTPVPSVAGSDDIAEILDVSAVTDLAGVGQ